MTNREEKEYLIMEAEAFPSLNGVKELIWHVLTSLKIKTFLWRDMRGALSLGELLEARGMSVDSSCQFCGIGEESVNHTLFACS